MRQSPRWNGWRGTTRKGYILTAGTFPRASMRKRSTGHAGLHRWPAENQATRPPTSPGRSRTSARHSPAPTPGAHPRVMDMLLTAQAHADMGDKEQARRFLDRAADLAGDAGEPPKAVYWYTEPFRLNIGLPQLGIGGY